MKKLKTVSRLTNNYNLHPIGSVPEKNNYYKRMRPPQQLREIQTKHQKAELIKQIGQSKIIIPGGHKTGVVEGIHPCSIKKTTNACTELFGTANRLSEQY